MEPIIIVTSINDHFTHPLAVMLTSLLENNIPKNIMKIYIIDGEISDENKNFLRSLLNEYKIKPYFLTPDMTKVENFKISDRISLETYFKLQIPDLLNRKIDKVLYLDADTIIRKDISNLWNTNLRGYCLGAVENPNAEYRKEALSIPNEESYFNAGVLLLNLRRWRKLQISKVVHDFIRNNPDKIELHEQDALNAVLFRNWLKLDFTWNYQIKRVDQINISDPAIVHFNGKKKPWNSSLPYKEEYDKYSKQISHEN